MNQLVGIIRSQSRSTLGRSDLSISELMWIIYRARGLSFLHVLLYLKPLGFWYSYLRILHLFLLSCFLDFYFFSFCLFQPGFFFPSFFTVFSKLSIGPNYFMTFVSWHVPDVMHGSSDLLQTRIHFPLWDAPPDYGVLKSLSGMGMRTPFDNLNFHICRLAYHTLSFRTLRRFE